MNTTALNTPRQMDGGGKGHQGGRWYLGSMNDGLFIIDQPPRPGNDYVCHDRTDGPSMVLNVTELSQEKAQAVVDAHNAALMPVGGAPGRPAAAGA